MDLLYLKRRVFFLWITFNRSWSILKSAEGERQYTHINICTYIFILYILALYIVIEVGSETDKWKDERDNGWNTGFVWKTLNEVKETTRNMHHLFRNDMWGFICLYFVNYYKTTHTTPTHYFGVNLLPPFIAHTKFSAHSCAFILITLSVLKMCFIHPMRHCYWVSSNTFIFYQ